MKKIILVLVALLSIESKAICQTSGTDYAFTTDVRVYKWDDASQSTLEEPTAYYRALRGAIYTIRQKVSFKNGTTTFTGYRISFWKFNGKNRQVQQATKGINDFKVYIIDKDQNDVPYFFVSEEDAKNNATSEFKKPHGFFKVDGVVLPVKMRFKNSRGGTFDLGQSISVGPAINFNLNYGGAFSQSSLSLLFGANISSIPVDEKTVPSVVTSKTTLLGLTPFSGINWEYHGVSLGVMGGIDVLSGKAEENWQYRGKPWLGFTIGTSLISTPKKGNQ